MDTSGRTEDADKSKADLGERGDDRDGNGSSECAEMDTRSFVWTGYRTMHGSCTLVKLCVSKPTKRRSVRTYE